VNKWDEKAKNYARYSSCKNSFEADILKSIKEFDVDFTDRSVIDVGCGTGVYTLHIAQIATEVLALDYSKNMLEILREDAKKLGIKNIKTDHGTWSDFDLNTRFDIAICTMSPAVKSVAEIEKFDTCANQKIYLGWAGTRDCTILDELFTAHKEIYSPPNGAKRVIKWLKSREIKYKEKGFEELKLRERTYSEALENYDWHLRVRGVKPNQKIIKNTIEKFCNSEKKVVEQTINKMKLLVW